MTRTPFQHASDLAARGYAVVPVPYKEKGAVIKGWPDLRIAAEDLPKNFNDSRQNIGVLPGSPSGGRIDVDLDHAQAVALADECLPVTGAMWGRASKPKSHRIFLVQGAMPSEAFKAERAIAGAKKTETKMLLEIRSDRLQTLAPGSVHPSGEEVRWDSDGEPALISAADLRAASVKLADRVFDELDLASQGWTKSWARSGREKASVAPIRTDTGTRPVERVLQALQDKGIAVTKSGKGFRGCCPAHADENPSFSVGEDERGNAVVKCFTGCTTDQIAESLGLAVKELFVAKRSEPRRDFTVRCKPSADANSGSTLQGSVTMECLPGSGKGRVRVTVRASDQIVHVDEIKPDNAKARKDFVKAVIAKRGEIDGAELDNRLMGLCDEMTNWQEEEEVADPVAGLEELVAQRDAESEDALAKFPASAITDAMAMLRDERLIDRVVEDLELAGVVGERELALTVYLVGTSRQLSSPLSAIVQGLSSSGKSYVIERTGGLFPPTAVLRATDITPNALYFLPPGTLVHRFVIAGERSRMEEDERAEATRALREMISAKEIRKVIPERAGSGSKLVTAEVWQPGPIAFIESTTLAKIFDEDANRCIMLGTDESAVQTERIVRAQAQRAAGETSENAAVVARHHALQLLLRRCEVLIPFAPQIADAIPTTRQEARRAMPQILAMIRAVATLHQYQRGTGRPSHGDTIVATLQDYVVARRLLVGPMGRSLGGALPDAVTRFGQRLFDRGEASFTSTDVVFQDDYVTSKGKVNEYLKALAEAGFVECAEASKGSKPARWRCLNRPPDRGTEWLPTIDHLREGGAQ